MKILITGAFSNIGKFLIEELNREGFSIRCFVLLNEKNKEIARGMDHVDVIFGDIRNKEDVRQSVKGCNSVVHLAFASPNTCEKYPLFAHRINIQGTKNLIEVAQEISNSFRIVFASSVSVKFYNMHKDTNVIDSLRYPLYAKDKLECEGLIMSSSLDWCLLRIGAILPTEFPSIDDLFHIPYNTRFEFIHIKDAVSALKNAAISIEASKKILLIGGGKEFRMNYGDFVNDILSIAGLEMPEKEDYSLRSYLTNWFDTDKSQRILQYQKHTYEYFLDEMRSKREDRAD